MMQRYKAGHKARSGRRGFALVEITVALSILVVLGLLLLKLSLNIVTPRSWMMHQTLADAFMTSERAAAERIPFEDLIAENSLWPRDVPMVVELNEGEGNSLPVDSRVSDIVDHLKGFTLPGGSPFKAISLSRVRLPEDEGSDETGNPAAMEIWRVQSSLRYEINGRPYEKTRTVIRMQ